MDCEGEGGRNARASSPLTLAVHRTESSLRSPTSRGTGIANRLAVCEAYEARRFLMYGLRRVRSRECFTMTYR